MQTLDLHLSQQNICLYYTSTNMYFNIIVQIIFVLKLETPCQFHTMRYIFKNIFIEANPKSLI